MGVGPGRAELRRTPLRRSSQNSTSGHFGEKGHEEEPRVERRASIVALDELRYISLYGGCSGLTGRRRDTRRAERSYASTVG